MKVGFCTPSLSGPTAPYIEAMEKSIPLIKDAGWEEVYAQEVGCPYISHARATMTRKALDAGADVLVYLDYDLSWDPEDLLTLLETDGDVVAGTYRFKTDKEAYMGDVVYVNPTPDTQSPGCRASDGAIKAHRVPAGFLKVTRSAIRHFMKSYPELMYGAVESPSVDLFNHGAHKGVWYGEDYAFSRNWTDAGGEIWIVPNLNITHHSPEKAYPGNFHKYLQKAGEPHE